MTKYILIATLALMPLVAQTEQTICFSKGNCNDRISYGVIGDEVKLCGGQCQGKSLIEMNKEGWKLIQVVGGLSNVFGMVLEKPKK